VVDNLDSGFSTVGSWILYSGGGYPCYGPNFVYSFPGTGADQAVFRPTLPVAGDYEVLIWWGTTPSGATNQPFVVNYNGGSTTTRVSFRGATGGGEWRSLGVFPFAAGTSGSVVTRDDADSYVGADAVRWVQVPPTMGLGADSGMGVMEGIWRGLSALLEAITSVVR